MVIIFLVCQVFFHLVLFQGDGGPLTIYGPAGIGTICAKLLESFKTRVSYPIKYVVLKEDGFNF